jgi:hypothetical protein
LPTVFLRRRVELAGAHRRLQRTSRAGNRILAAVWSSMKKLVVQFCGEWKFYLTDQSHEIYCEQKYLVFLTHNATFANNLSVEKNRIAAFIGRSRAAFTQAEQNRLSGEKEFFDQ